MRLTCLALSGLLAAGCVGDPPRIGDAPATTPAVRIEGGAESVGDCPVAAVAAGKARLTELHDRWKDALDVAKVTPRIGLSGPVGKLQELKREAEHLPVPACLNKARHELYANITVSVSAMLLFMDTSTPGSESTSASVLAAAQNDDEAFMRSTEEAEKCAPDCPELVAWKPGPPANSDAAESASELATATATDTEPEVPAAATTQETVVTDAHAKVTEANESWARFAWLAQITNPNSVPVKFDIEVDFNDAQRFTIDSDKVYDQMLGPGESRLFHGDTLVSFPGAANVDGIHAWVKLR